MPEMTYRDAINAALAEELERDESVFLLGEDVGLFGGAMAVTKGLYDRFGPRRVMDMPISESVIVGGALGAAAVALRLEILLVILGGLFVLETLSVIGQVGSFKLTGKRILRMAPLHHHLELSGWREVKIVCTAYVAQVLLATVSVVLVARVLGGGGA